MSSSVQAASVCHSARAAERRSLQVVLSMSWRSKAKWLWTFARTEANFCSVLIRLNRSTHAHDREIGSIVGADRRKEPVRLLETLADLLNAALPD